MPVWSERWAARCTSHTLAFALLTTTRIPRKRSGSRSDCAPNIQICTLLLCRLIPNLKGSSQPCGQVALKDRKSTRLNSSHLVISYAVFCLKKKKNIVVYHSSP